MNPREGHSAGEDSLGVIHGLPRRSFGPWASHGLGTQHASGDTAMGVLSMHHGLRAAYSLGQD